jgi:hypothetical protein
VLVAEDRHRSQLFTRNCEAAMLELHLRQVRRADVIDSLRTSHRKHRLLPSSALFALTNVLS